LDIALRDFVIELASIIVEALPSSGSDGCKACERMARDRWSDHYIVEEEIGEILRPLTWVDAEISSLFGSRSSVHFDRACVQELRSSGYAQACGYHAPT
jgi:hypothetical protein